MALSEHTKGQIQQLLSDHEVVLFMKGTRRQPRCGFSATVVQILDGLGVSYRDVDVLADPGLRDGIKEFGNWPTIPQLYYKGSLVGGCDIVRELDSTGELAGTLGLAAPAPGESPPPSVQVSPAAAAVIQQAAQDAGPGQLVRLTIRDGGRTHDMAFDERQKGDQVVDSGGVSLLLDRASARLANGVKIDFVEGPSGSGFTIDNPNAPPKVKTLTARELKQKLDAGEPLRLYDVRGDGERAIAAIPGAIALNERAQAELLALPKDTPLVFHCHHGMRSQAAAEHFLAQGFKNVWNLKGGIDAWSSEVDPTVRRY